MTPKDQAKIEAAVLEAIDAATKPLREERERLKEEMFERDMALSDDWAKIQKGIEEQAEAAVARAEARNKALVEALKEIAQAASETCNRHPTWTAHTGHELLCESARQEIRARAALAAHEERSKALEAPKP